MNGNIDSSYSSETAQICTMGYNNWSPYNLSEEEKPPLKKFFVYDLPIEEQEEWKKAAWGTAWRLIALSTFLMLVEYGSTMNPSFE